MRDSVSLRMPAPLAITQTPASPRAGTTVTFSVAGLAAGNLSLLYAAKTAFGPVNVANGTCNKYLATDSMLWSSGLPEQGRDPEAEPKLGLSVEQLHRTHGDDVPVTLKARAGHGLALARMRRAEDGIAASSAALVAFGHESLPEGTLFGESALALGQTLRVAGQAVDAAQWQDRGLAALEQTLGAAHLRLKRLREGTPQRRVTAAPGSHSTRCDGNGFAPTLHSHLTSPLQGSRLTLPSPLLDVLGRALQEILNRALALDALAAARLKALSGRSVELTWSTADIGLRLGVENGAVTVGPRQGAGRSDLGVSGSLAGLLSLAGLGASRSGPGNRVEVSGDAQLAREIENLVRGASPNLEVALADRFGNTAGPVIARALLGAWRWTRDSATSLREDVAEYLVEESGDVIGEVELGAFHREVDALRDRVERLEQRVAHVKRASAS